MFLALKSFGAPLAEMSETDFASEGFYQMGRPPVRVDILMTIDGVDFQDAWRNRVETTFDTLSAHLIRLSDLLANKRSAGRPQDLMDIEKMILSQQIAQKIAPENEPPEEKNEPAGTP